MLGCAAIDRGEPLRFTHLFDGFKEPHFIPLMLIGVINMGLALAIVVIGFAGVAGSLGLSALMGAGNANLDPYTLWESMGFGVLFGILAVLVLVTVMAMVNWFAPALIVLRDAKPAEAMKASFRACLRNWVPFLVYGAIGLLIGVAVMIVFGTVFATLGLSVVFGDGDYVGHQGHRRRDRARSPLPGGRTGGDARGLRFHVRGLSRHVRPGGRDAAHAAALIDAGAQPPREARPATRPCALTAPRLLACALSALRPSSRRRRHRPPAARASVATPVISPGSSRSHAREFGLRHLEHEFVVDLQDQLASPSRSRSSQPCTAIIASLMRSAAVPCIGALIAARSAPARRGPPAALMSGSHSRRPNTVST